MILKQDTLSANNQFDFREIWESYADLWKTEDEDHKRQKLSKILTGDFRYTDPRSETIGHDALINVILDFNNTVPGAYFSTTRFMTHNNRSVATWEMKSVNAETLGSGISYAEYDQSGKLMAISGFYDLPTE